MYLLFLFWDHCDITPQMHTLVRIRLYIRHHRSLKDANVNMVNVKMHTSCPQFTSLHKIIHGIGGSGAEPPIPMHCGSCDKVTRLRYQRRMTIRNFLYKITFFFWFVINEVRGTELCYDDLAITLHLLIQSVFVPSSAYTIIFSFRV